MLRFLITIFLANGCLLSPLLANIEYLIAFKEQVYSQEGNNTPTGPMLWYFNAGVSGDAQVTGGTVTYPGSGGAVVLTGSDGTYTTDGDDFPTREAMDAVFPNGDISLSIVDNGETLDFGPFNLSGDTYPPAPHFLNLQEFRDHNFSQDFLLRWDAFAGAGPNDKVIIQIFDPELEELLVFEVLPGDTTSFNIPGGIFSEFFSYEMELFFLKATDALEVPETLIGYISSNYTSFDPGFSGGGGVVNIPDQAVKDAVKLALDLFPEDDVTEEAMGTLNSLQVTSDVPVDLTGLEFAYGLIELTLNSEEVTSFLPILDLIDLEEVKLVAPQKPDLFFTHWSDGSQENPRIIELTGQQDFGLTAQYSNVPLSPFAGGYAYIVNGTVATALSLPAGLNVNVGDPYELRLNYLILEDAMSGDGDSSVALIYDKGRLAMEVEVRIKNYRWILRSTNEGSGNASIYSTALDGIEIFEFNLTDSDGSTESEFPFSNGNETISFTIRTNLNTGKLFNGSLKIPDDPGYVNWSDITSGTGNLMSGNPNWLITLSTLPGPNQSYRIEKLPSYLDLSRSIAGYATNRPTAEVERSTDYLNIYWNDPYYPNFETTYEVWRGTSSNLSSARMVADELVEPAYGDSDVLPGKAYFYWIRAIRDGLKADFSLPVSNFRAVAYPEDVQATQGDFADRIRVSWARVSGATSYTIYRDVTEDFDTAEMLAEGITGNEYEDYTPDSDDPYFYWVVSEAFGVYSEFSNSARGYRVANGINTVRASDGLYSDYVRITWEAFPEATTYTVYRNS
ncbi:MAG: hypothetical protein KJT03_03580, partial [Verrucomicrobiae bacterium]|nr:hypothetical protein [Verrucomicrobiae bacterium]